MATYNANGIVVEAQMAQFEGNNGTQHPTKEGWATIQGQAVWVLPSNEQYPSEDIDFPDFNSIVHTNDAKQKILNGSVNRRAWIKIGDDQFQQ